MRPEERIEPMIALLRDVWLAHPDQRLGQLIGNLCREPSDWTSAFGFGKYRDPFNVEDDEIWAALTRVAEQ